MRKQIFRIIWIKWRGKQQCRIACYHPHERVNFTVCIVCPIFPNILKWGEILCKGLVKAIKWQRKQWLLLEFLEVPSQSTRCVLFLPFLSIGHKQIKQVKHWKVGPFGKDGKPFRKIQLLCVCFFARPFQMQGDRFTKPRVSCWFRNILKAPDISAPKLTQPTLHRLKLNLPTLFPPFPRCERRWRCHRSARGWVGMAGSLTNWLENPHWM